MHARGLASRWPDDVHMGNLDSLAEEPMNQGASRNAHHEIHVPDAHHEKHPDASASQQGSIVSQDECCPHAHLQACFPSVG